MGIRKVSLVTRGEVKDGGHGNVVVAGSKEFYLQTLPFLRDRRSTDMVASEEATDLLLLFFSGGPIFVRAYVLVLFATLALRRARMPKRSAIRRVVFANHIIKLSIFK